MSRTAHITFSILLAITGCVINLYAASFFPHAVLYPSGDQPSLGTIADFNGDGNLDVLLIAAPGKQSRLSVLPGVGGGKFGTVIDSPDLHHAVDQAVAGDMNGDGVTDVVALNYSHSSLYVSVNLGNGDGTFAELERDVAGGSYAGTRLLLGDFNNDGYLDVA